MRGNKELTEKLLKVLLTEDIKFKVKNVSKAKYEVIIFNKKELRYGDPVYLTENNEMISFNKYSVERRFSKIFPSVEIKIL
jgi:hypothetical protein